MTLELLWFPVVGKGIMRVGGRGSKEEEKK